MATHSSVLAWRIPGTGEPGGLPSMRSHRVGHDWSDLAAAAAHASKVMLKILQARFQQDVNCELPDVQAGFRKGRGTRDQIANIHWISKKLVSSKKTSIFASLAMLKALTVWIMTNCGKFFKRWEYQTILRNLYAGQEATVRTGHGTTDWFQIRKGVRQGCILSPCLFNLYDV